MFRYLRICKTFHSTIFFSVVYMAKLPFQIVHVFLSNLEISSVKIRLVYFVTKTRLSNLIAVNNCINTISLYWSYNITYIIDLHQLLKLYRLIEVIVCFIFRKERLAFVGISLDNILKDVSLLFNIDVSKIMLVL